MKKYVSLFLVTLLCVIVMFQLTACGCNHDRVTTINAVPATCTQTGLTSGSRCLDCGEIVRKPQSTPAVGHKLVTQNGESATCQKTGLTDGKYCSVCGYVSIQQTVIPKSNCVEDSNGCCVTCGDILNPFKFIVTYVKSKGSLSGDQYMYAKNVYTGQVFGIFYNVRDNELSFALLGENDDGSIQSYVTMDYNPALDKQELIFEVDYLNYGASDYATGYIYKSTAVSGSIYIFNYAYQPGVSSALKESVRDLFESSANLLITFLDNVLSDMDRNLSVEDLGFVNFSK